MNSEQELGEEAGKIDQLATVFEEDGFVFLRQLGQRIALFENAQALAVFHQLICGHHPRFCCRPGS